MLEFRQEVRCHDAGAGAQLQDGALLQGREHLGALAGEAAGEERREFRRGDEITGGAELAGTGAVIA